jgi:hypothetical protein
MNTQKTGIMSITKTFNATLLLITVYMLLLPALITAQVDTATKSRFEKLLNTRPQSSGARVGFQKFISEDTIAAKSKATHFIPISLSQSVLFNSLESIEKKAYKPAIDPVYYVLFNDTSLPVSMWQYYFENIDKYYIIEEWKFRDTSITRRMYTYFSQQYSAPQFGTEELNPKPLFAVQSNYMYILSSPIVNYDPDQLDKYWQRLLAR